MEYEKNCGCVAPAPQPTNLSETEQALREVLRETGDLVLKLNAQLTQTDMQPYEEIQPSCIGEGIFADLVQAKTIRENLISIFQRL